MRFILSFHLTRPYLSIKSWTDNAVSFTLHGNSCCVHSIDAIETRREEKDRSRFGGKSVEDDEAQEGV